MDVRFLGSGDAFGSGGRFQACIAVDADGGRVLVDCGASSLIAMKRFGVDPASVDAVVVSHLHGDHFGGLPFFVLDQQFGRRERPLLIAGPPGIEARVVQAMEVLFPGSSAVERRFAVKFFEFADRLPVQVGPVAVTPFEVVHASGAAAFALRVEAGGRTLAYTGDTEWSDVLVDASDGADLFVSEAYFFEKVVKFHLAYGTLREHLPRMRYRRLILTHAGPDVLARRAELEAELAEDGLVVSI